MIYNPLKIKKLLDSVEDNLTEEQQQIVKEIVSNYNKLFITVKDKVEYIDNKRETYLKESTENDKLRQENKELKRSNNRLKKQNQEQRILLKEYIK